MLMVREIFDSNTLVLTKCKMNEETAIALWFGANKWEGAIHLKFGAFVLLQSDWLLLNLFPNA
jgi:hypothetical protein